MDIFISGSKEQSALTGTLEYRIQETGDRMVTAYIKSDPQATFIRGEWFGSGRNLPEAATVS